MICPTGEAKYFCKWGWTGKLQRRPTGKSPVDPARERAATSGGKFDAVPLENRTPELL